MEVNGREVVDVKVSGVDPSDYPDFCDAYFCYAIYEDTGAELDAAELELLSGDCADILNEMAYEHYI